VPGQKKNPGIELNPLIIVAIQEGKTAYYFYKRVLKICDYPCLSK
jgi:hypothetical protein